MHAVAGSISGEAGLSVPEDPVRAAQLSTPKEGGSVPLIGPTLGPDPPVLASASECPIASQLSAHEEGCPVPLMSAARARLVRFENPPQCFPQLDELELPDMEVNIEEE